MSNALKVIFRCSVVVFVSLMATLLSGCAVEHLIIGPQSIAASGKQMMILEYNGNPPESRATQLNLETGEVISHTIQVLGSNSIVDLSANGRYAAGLLERIPILLDFSTGITTALSDSSVAGQSAEFLPNGQLLVRSISSQQIRSVVVVDPGTPRTPIWAPITDIKYVITDQYQEIASLRARLGLSDLLAKTLSESSATLRTAGGSCGSFINGLATWLIVKTDGSMVTLSADNSSPTITHSVSISATDAIAGLIQQQTNAMPPDILEQIKGELQQKFPTLGGAEIEWLIEEQVMQLANFTNSIKFSSDQRYPTLLFLLTEKTPNFQYTLYSVGLDSGIEQQISEGSVTKRPSFDFSPDGKQIVYDAYDRGENVIRIRNVDGTNDRIVARNGSGACWH